MALYILIVILSIIIHELGHLLTALYFKVKVKAFSVGFGKILLHKTWKGIDWRLSLVPLGGYCDIEERIGQPNSLAEIPYWKQMIIVLAGVTCNLLVAVICYLINFKSIKLGLYIDWIALKAIISSDYYELAIALKGHLFSYPLLQTSMLNMGLAITNLLPLPALDGGFIWLLPLQRKLSQRVYRTIIYVGFTSLMILQFVLIYYWWIK